MYTDYFVEPDIDVHIDFLNCPLINAEILYLDFFICY
jgi:hypothetical protein